MRILLALLILSPASLLANNLSGRWAWDGNSDRRIFSLILKRSESNTYNATYCAVGSSGARIDCSPNFPKTFNFILGQEFEFKTNYSSKLGSAKITATNNKLIWQITNSPNGEHYAPNKASLTKQ